jgi:mono/diheme cytochrome c family protein
VDLGGAAGQVAATDGPANQGPAFPHATGDATRGLQVFRYETFGNEGFWTDAVRLPQGIVAAGLTPKQVLQFGLSVDLDALGDTLKASLATEVGASGLDGPMLNDPATTLALLDANAVIGLVVHDTDADGTLDVAKGDKVGLSCASCHSITDQALAGLPNGGGIGHRIDGLAQTNLDLGHILAAAANSRALFPLLQLRLAARNNTSVGRAPDAAAITADSTEDDVDAYLTNPAFYPVGTFDALPDGVGGPTQIPPLFRTDFSAPYGSAGQVARLDNFNNFVYTTVFDPTVLVTGDGINFLKASAGADAAAEIADSYQRVLTATGVRGPAATTVGTGFPFVTATLPAGTTAGTEPAPTGRRVDEQKLRDLSAYTDGLHSPIGTASDSVAVTRGRDAFRTAGCIACHNVSQARRVPSLVVPELTVFPGYMPTVIAARPATAPYRLTDYSAIQDDPASSFDDDVVVADASPRGEVRGAALPLLMDLGRKTTFLHDASVTTLDTLLDSGRGATAPHPFYADMRARTDIIEFLKSLEDTR